MTERFAIICHGMWKQCCLVNLTLVTTGLPVASCQIYCRLLPAGIDVACICFLQILSYFPFSFMLLQPRVSGKVRQRTHWKQKGSLTSTRTPLHSSQILVSECWQGPGLHTLPAMLSCGRMELSVWSRLKFAGPKEETTRLICLSLKPDCNQDLKNEKLWH